MKRAAILLLSLACGCATPGTNEVANPANVTVTLVEHLPTVRANRWYGGHRAPLEVQPLSKLPLGAVEARGWLREQLELQMEGFHGHLGEISPFLRKPGNAWLSPTGEGDHGWEEVPYWLKGFGDCAYLLGDEVAIAEARIWIEAALASQRPDGFFGPRGNGAKSTVSSTDGEWDLWPNMPMMDALRSWHEHSGDPRVLELLARYFRWQLTLTDAQFVPPYWQHLRACDNLWSVWWLHDRTTDEALRADLYKLAEKIQRCAARWEDGVIDWHNVNVLEGFGGPTWYASYSHDERQRSAAERNFREFREKYGQVPGGLFGADEVARPGATDPRQAVETCGMVEFLFSCERLLLVTGDPVWADRLEDVAFNSLPGAQTPDLKALRYLSAPNMAVSDRRSHNPGIMNSGPMFCFDPNDHRCCQHNVGHGWPYLAQHLWMATADDGLALMVPLASRVKAKVGEQGREVEFECSSDYPFRTEVAVRVVRANGERFPLVLRLPGWACGGTVMLNGHEVPAEVVAGRYLRLEREWNPGDVLDVNLRTELELVRWDDNKGAVSVQRGPLTYALGIPERVERSGGTDAWPAFEYFPAAPWNYALELGDSSPVVRETHGEISDLREVWTLEHVPSRLVVRARKAPGWKLDEHGLVARLVPSPVVADAQVEEVELVPMGAARLRISAFPVAGAGSSGLDWPMPPASPHPDWKVTASHCFGSDTPLACLDGAVPLTSNDSTIARHTWWPEKGNEQWVQYDFPAPLLVEECEVYWFDDTPGGGCAVPRDWRIEALDESGVWRTVEPFIKDEPARDRWCSLSFSAPLMSTRSLRLVALLAPDRSAGVLEWRVQLAD
ncbi:MAG: glycoside hydrolase family 127 protein [Planctomycetaceae bacterium]|nr:glycoside hydrolase family 127 protein [Planctomycetaceae bacterium]